VSVEAEVVEVDPTANGHAPATEAAEPPELASTPEFEARPLAPLRDDPEAARIACSVCGAAIPPGRADRGGKTCSEGCAAAARRRRDKLAKKTARAAAAPAGATPAGSEAPDLSQTPERPFEAAVGHTEAAAGNRASQPRGSRLAEVFDALMLAGASVVRFEVTDASETWAVSITRTNGGASP
jgi:hypothetical protein